MAAIRIEGFTGIAPRYSDRLLPPHAATIAANVRLTSGELRGLHELLPVRTFSGLGGPARRAFRIPANIQAPAPFSGGDFWVPFLDEEVDFVRSPVLDDSFERYYWTGDSTTYGGAPKYNPRTRITASSPPFRLGIPRPVAAPAVTPPGSGTITRAYVYTFISAYGEEGQPSDPTLATGAAGTWNLSGLDASVPNPTERNITHVRIYRTVPGTASTLLFRVGQVALGVTTFADSMSDTDAARNPILESETWAGPPAGLQGLTVHPGGFLVGFRGRDLYFSEPFRPHAWPVAYVLTCQTEIVGLAVFNNSIVVATTSNPYIGEGIHPASIALQKLDSADACLSRRSVVTTLAGVMYASVQGIVLVAPGVHRLVTEQVFTRQEWYGRFQPETVMAAPYGLQYLAFNTPSTGFAFSFSERDSSFSTLDLFSGITGIQVDQYTGDVYVLQGSHVLLWDQPFAPPLAYQWRSKVFELPSPVNFGALQVKFDSAAPPANLDLEAYRNFNATRITQPLNSVNLSPVASVRRMTVPGFPHAQNRSPVGGSPLFPLGVMSTPAFTVTVRVSARMQDSTMATVFFHTVTGEVVHRLPADFMSDVWQVELVSNTPVFSFAMAETAKGLGRV